MVPVAAALQALGTGTGNWYLDWDWDRVRNWNRVGNRRYNRVGKWNRVGDRHWNWVGNINWSRDAKDGCRRSRGSGGHRSDRWRHTRQVESANHRTSSKNVGFGDDGKISNRGGEPTNSSSR